MLSTSYVNGKARERSFDLVIFWAHDHTNPKRQRGIQPFLPRWRFGLVSNQQTVSCG